VKVGDFQGKYGVMLQPSFWFTFSFFVLHRLPMIQLLLLFLVLHLLQIIYDLVAEFNPSQPADPTTVFVTVMFLFVLHLQRPFHF
jgi:hypothetical protein